MSAAADFGEIHFLIDFTKLFPRQRLGTPLVKERPIGGARRVTPSVQRRADQQRRCLEEALNKRLSSCGFFIG